MFDEGDKNIQWRKDSLFNKWCCKNWTATFKRMKLEHFLIPYTKINSKQIENINVRWETIKLLEENIGSTVFDINHSKILYDPPPRVMETKTKINKWDLRELIKLKKLLHSKCNHKQDKKTILRMGKSNCKWSNWQRINLQNLQAAHAPQYHKKRHFSKEGIQDG